MKPNNWKDLLKQHTDISPWEKIGTNLFEINGHHYLISVDYFSNFIEVDHMPFTTSSQVISMLKKQFARFGTLRVIVSVKVLVYVLRICEFHKIVGNK